MSKVCGYQCDEWGRGAVRPAGGVWARSSCPSIALARASGATLLWIDLEILEQTNLVRNRCSLHDSNYTVWGLGVYLAPSRSLPRHHNMASRLSLCPSPGLCQPGFSQLHLLPRRPFQIRNLPPGRKSPMLGLQVRAKSAFPRSATKCPLFCSFHIKSAQRTPPPKADTMPKQQAAITSIEPTSDFSP